VNHGGGGTMELVEKKVVDRQYETIKEADGKMKASSMSELIVYM
jgi:hypothetical protein